MPRSKAPPGSVQRSSGRLGSHAGTPPDGMSRPIGDITRRPDEVAAIRSLLHAAVPHAIQTLVQIMLNEDARDNDRIQAAGKILEFSTPRPIDTGAEQESTRDLVNLLAGGDDVIDSTEVVVDADD